MLSGIPLPAFRLTLLALPALAQAYLFMRVRQALLRSRGSRRRKLAAIALAALVMALLFAMNGYIMFTPMPWLDPPAAARALIFYLPAVWAIGSIFSALLLGLARFVLELTTAAARLSGPSGPIPDPGRRRFLRTGVAGLATAPFLLSAYGAAYDRKTYEASKLTVPFGRCLRVVHLSDIHAGPYMTRKEMRRYADRVIALHPDLFVLTGDFISNSTAFLPECLEEMARVRATYGTFAVLGNHERWYGAHHELLSIFRQEGVPLLVNANQVIRTAQGPFAVAGIDDLRNGHPNLERALRGLDPALPTILLSHRPEIFPQAAARGIPLTLAGHWHGGQIKLVLPGVVISPAHLRTPYPEGLYRIGASRLYVSRGIGTTFTPVRLNAPPEVTLITLT